MKYNVLFGLFKFGLDLDFKVLALASISVSRIWPRPRPLKFGLDLGLDFKVLALASISSSRVWPRPRPRPKAFDLDLLLLLHYFITQRHRLVLTVSGVFKILRPSLSAEIKTRSTSDSLTG